MSLLDPLESIASGVTSGALAALGALLLFLLRPVRRFARYLWVAGIKYWRPIYDRNNSDLKQARMRYFAMRLPDDPLPLPDGPPGRIVYQVATSKGHLYGYVDGQGRAFRPQSNPTPVGEPTPHCPAWGATDWQRIFDGEPLSGCWPIAPENASRPYQ